MFDDKRGKQLVLCAHCVLNQNAKLDRCAHCSGAVAAPVLKLIEAGVGIVQMPCPELLIMGLERRAVPGSDASVGEEDTRIGRFMATADATRRMEAMAEEIVAQVLDYRKHGFEIVGMIGIDGSPTCGVEISWFDDKEQRIPGLFVALLAGKLASKGIVVPTRGIRSARPAEAARAVEELLLGGGGRL